MKESEKQRQIPSISYLSPQAPTPARAWRVEARSQELYSGILHGWPVPYLGYHPFLLNPLHNNI